MLSPSLVQALPNVITFGGSKITCSNYVMRSCEKASMRKLGRIFVVSQHYLADRSTTTTIMSAIAGHLATVAPVLVLSGTPSSGSYELMTSNKPTVLEIKNRMPGKAALFKRAIVEVLFTLRIFTTLFFATAPWRCCPHRHGAIYASLRGDSSGKRRDDDLDRSRDQAVSEVIGVISLVCEQSSGLDQPQQRLSLRDIVDLAAGQDEPQRITKAIDDHVDFRREPTARAADGLVETLF